MHPSYPVFHLTAGYSTPLYHIVYYSKLTEEIKIVRILDNKRGQVPRTMPENEFIKLYNSISRCYSKKIEEKLPKIHKEKDVLSGNVEDNYYKSISLRMEAINELRNARDNGIRIDTKNIWNKISASFSLIPADATISSIGSQGFLSIPLFKYDDKKSNFEFIRLHIWHNSLDKYVNTQTRDSFSIHSHSFHAESWVLCGEIINDRFIIKEETSFSPYSLFNIEYNSSLNEINQHTSVAVRQSQFVEPIQISHEVYMQHGNYTIKAGEYHRSGSNRPHEIAATLFSFTADIKYNGPSYVVGPTDIDSSKINRKELINPLELISKIDHTIK